MAEQIWKCEHCDCEFRDQATCFDHERKCPKNDAALENFSERIQNLEIQMDKFRKAVSKEIEQIRRGVHSRLTKVEEDTDKARREARRK